METSKSNLLELAALVDSAYAQNIITFNEVREYLGLAPIKDGDVCKNGKLIDQCLPVRKK